MNCYNFATVSSQYGKVGGIVGTVKGTFSTKNKAQCMVFACVNYGWLDETASGNKRYPVIGGQDKSDNKTIVNNRLNIYNYYYLFDEYTKTDLDDAHLGNDGSYGFEAKFLNRFEFVRHILNSKRKHSGWWVMARKNFDGTDANNTEKPLTYFNDTVEYGVRESVIIGTWVLDTTIAPFPVVLPKYDEDGDLIVYRSIINPDYDSAWRDNAAPYQGRRLTEWWCADAIAAHKGRLKVTVKCGDRGRGLGNVEQWISITDMDTLAYDWNYGKIQLPYYQSVFHTPKISAGDSIVTGWKITSVTGGTTGSLTTTGNNAYNFADRNCTSKDIYSNTNKRVFAQGGYYNVPYGVTEIEIEAYWGKAYYVSEAFNDSYDNGGPNDNTMYGPASKTAYGVDKSLMVYDSVIAAITAITNTTGSVYDNAIVLLSDAHDYTKFANEAQKDNTYNAFSLKTSNKNLTQPFTLTTIDEDYDNEPDHCLFHFFSSRRTINPIRLDFIPYLDYSMSGISNAKYYRYLGIFKPKGHFEITETALTRFYQFEYEETSLKSARAPLILNGGVFEQMVTSKHNGTKVDKTQYIQVGGHVWFKLFAPGTHPDQNFATKHCPVTVTGGEYKSFYLTSYLATVTADIDNNSASFFASGGRIGEYASGGNESITGDVTVKVDHLVVDNFYGGGINVTEKITGDINVTIDSSIVHGIFAAGPKFGSMGEGKKVKARATGTTFNTYYGAGYGGTSLSSTSSLLQSGVASGSLRHKSKLEGKYNKGKYTTSGDNDATYDNVAGIEIDYTFELMPMSSSNGNYVDRVYIHKANLSMAETENVWSTLTGCTVKGNFYGGGFVGLVQGTATDSLRDCRVMGNVFAGGNSATLPTAKVYNLPGAEEYPTLASGTFFQVDKNELVTPVEYIWTNDESVKNGTTYIKEIGNKKYIYAPKATTDLEKVGKCQATNLTVINTVVGTPGDTNTGSIYGGGNEAAMEVLASGGTCSASVKVEGNTRVYRDVFGAGKEGLHMGRQQMDEDEFLNVEFVPIESAVEEILSGKITDGKTQAAVLKAWLILKNRKQEP